MPFTPTTGINRKSFHSLKLPSAINGSDHKRNNHTDILQRKKSVQTEFNTKFSCRNHNLKELESFYNVAKYSISKGNSYSKVIGIEGEGGIGKSRLVLEFQKKLSRNNSAKFLTASYSDSNNFIFKNEVPQIKEYLEQCILKANKSKLPLIVIIEDVHWFNPKEKIKLEKLIFDYSGELPSPIFNSVIFILTYRNTGSISKLKNLDAFLEINLELLNEAESKTFIKNSDIRKGKKLSIEIECKIVHLSTGNPFYIEEYLKEFCRGNTGGIMPDTIKELIELKLTGIDQGALRILEIIALWDGEIEYGILERICEQLNLFLPGKKELHNINLLRVAQSKGDCKLNLIHDIYKEVIHNNIDANLKIILHKSIAELLESENANEFLLKLHYHFINANENEKAFHYLEKHISKCIETGEYELALEKIDELIDYFSSEEEKNIEIILAKIKCLRSRIRKKEMGNELTLIEKTIIRYQSTELFLKYLLQLEEYYFLSNDFTQAFRLINKGIKLSKIQKNEKMEVEFQFLLTRNLNTTGKVNECLKEARKLLSLSNLIGNKKHYLWAQYYIAVNLQFFQNYIESNQIIEKCIYETKSESNVVFLNKFYKVKTKYYFLTKDYNRFLVLSKEQYRLDIYLHETHQALQTLLNIADCSIKLKNFSESKNTLNSILVFAEKNDSLLFKKRAYEGLMSLYLETDNFHDAQIIGNKLIHLYDKNDYRNLSMLYSNLMEICFMLDDINLCAECYKKALFFTKKTGSIIKLAIAHYNIGYIYYLSGVLLYGEKYIKKSYNLLKKHNGLECHPEVVLTYAEILLSKGYLKNSSVLLKSSEFIFNNSKVSNEKYFYKIFNKLMINSAQCKKIEEFLDSDCILNFFMNSSIDIIAKLKIIFFTLLISQAGNILFPVNKLDEIKRLINLNIRTKNRTILFYLNQIPKK